MVAQWIVYPKVASSTFVISALIYGNILMVEGVLWEHSALVRFQLSVLYNSFVVQRIGHLTSNQVMGVRVAPKLQMNN